MSAPIDQTQKGSPSPTYRMHGPWENAWKLALLLGGIGFLGLLVGWLSDERRFAFSYLFAFVTFLTIGLGALFFVVVQHLTVAGWSVTVRRTAEFYLIGLPIFAILFAPLAFYLGDILPWMEHHEEAAVVGQAHGEGEEPAGEHEGHAHENEHAAAEGEGDHAAASHHTPMEVQLHHEIMEKKAWYLNPAFFWGRAGIYFIAWIWLAWFFFTSSTKQDETKDPKLTVKMQSRAPIAAIIFGFTLTFAMFDWVMSLEPSWYSTIYGVYIFAASTVAIFALLIVTCLALRASGQLGEAVNVEHFHDLGKLMFGFVVFHAYVGFSQMMLIWYASIPEEVTFYQARWHGGGWKGVSMLIVLGHFAVPFIFLMSRHIKRRLGLLGFGAAWLLVMHVVDMYWFVMPNFAPDGLAMHWMDLAALFAVGGIYFGLVFWLMRRYPLIPIGDPRLGRALRFQNA